MVKPSTSGSNPSPSERSDSIRYKGVRKRKWGKYVSEIRLPNSRERIWLGSYDTPEKAARAFDAALFCLRGHSAKFNFPDNPPDIAGGRKLTPSEIQLAACRFANSEPPRINSGHFSSDLPMDSSSSQSPSVSEGTVQLDSDASTMDGSSLIKLYTTIGSENNVSDFGIFPGFDDLTYDYFTPQPPPPSPAAADYADENCDGYTSSESFLWNF
ncbi:AP2/ERF domain [Dillenia turbinata]|uniref:AP2/ERF domain n=1 Tax=Dillenia turbinata TaxID=194707 RepID=A0AAN8WAH5_9MAGN